MGNELCGKGSTGRRRKSIRKSEWGSVPDHGVGQPKQTTTGVEVELEGTLAADVIKYKVEILEKFHLLEAQFSSGSCLYLELPLMKAIYSAFLWSEMAKMFLVPLGILNLLIASTTHNFPRLPI